MKWRFCWAFLPFFGFVISLVAQNPELSKEVKQYVKVDAPKVVLLHVRVIDGTGSAAIEDQNVVIGKGAGVLTANDRATFLDLNGYTVMPGVGLKSYLSSGKSSAMAMSLRPTSFHESSTTFSSGSAGLTAASFSIASCACAGKVNAPTNRAIARNGSLFICVLHH